MPFLDLSWLIVYESKELVESLTFSVQNPHQNVFLSLNCWNWLGYWIIRVLKITWKINEWNSLNYMRNRNNIEVIFKIKRPGITSNNLCHMKWSEMWGRKPIRLVRPWILTPAKRCDKYVELNSFMLEILSLREISGLVCSAYAMGIVCVSHTFWKIHV